MRLPRVLLPVLGIAMVAAAYWLTFAPYLVGNGDSGDLIAACAVGGVPHPSGYPLYVMMGKLLLLAFPSALPATLLNLFSVLCALLTVICIALAVLAAAPREASGPARDRAVVGGIIAGGLLAFGNPFWSQAVRAEVYTLHTALAAVVIWQALRCFHRCTPGRFLLIAVAFGCALGNHLTSLLLAPALGYAIWRWRVPRRLLIAGSLAAVLTVSLLYGYLMLCAAAAPPLNWGDPSTPDRLWDVITLKLYSTMRTPELYLAAKSRMFISQFNEQFGLRGTPLAAIPVVLLAIGTISLWRRNGAAARFLVLAAGCSVAAVIVLFSHTDLPHIAHAITNHFLTGFLVLAVLIGCGVSELLARLQLRPLAARLALAALLVTVGLMGLVNGQRNDLSGYTDVHSYALNLLQGLPRGSVLLSHSDMTHFPLTYVQLAEGVRTDVAVVNDRLLGYGWYYKSLPASLELPFPGFAEPEMNRRAAITLILERCGDGPGVYIGEYIPADYFAGYEMVMHGLHFRIARMAEGLPLADNCQLLDALLLPNLAARPPEPELPLVRFNLAFACDRVADEAARDGRPRLADEYRRRALTLRQSVPVDARPDGVQ